MPLPSADTETSNQIAEWRAFNRFWTKLVGALNAGLLDSPYSLAEVRVVFELAHRSPTTSSAIRVALGLDSGYLSRILTRLKDDGVVTSSRSAVDGRRQELTLTRNGRRLFASLDRRADDEIRSLLDPLSPASRRRLLGAMRVVRALLDDREVTSSFVLRPLEPGDLGWVLERHGALYRHEHGFDDAFEALVAKVLGDYATRHDPKKENGWIAERDGERVGSIFCMKKTARTAQLRLLLVEPSARGAGIGWRLVDECIRFATRAGYREMILWTKDVLHDARRIYERAGFELVDQEDETDSAGAHGQHWRRALTRVEGVLGLR
jgi:DNA-binding MarR family transcriptional regulator/N-acetylglutamate synthase-like GNAT family acetyltransferase